MLVRDRHLKVHIPSLPYFIANDLRLQWFTENLALVACKCTSPSLIRMVSTTRGSPSPALIKAAPSSTLLDFGPITIPDSSECSGSGKYCQAATPLRCLKATDCRVMSPENLMRCHSRTSSRRVEMQSKANSEVSACSTKRGSVCESEMELTSSRQVTSLNSQIEELSVLDCSPIKGPLSQLMQRVTRILQIVSKPQE